MKHSFSAGSLRQEGLGEGALNLGETVGIERPKPRV